MANTPPDSPDLAAREQQAARVLAEHLPEGYTAEFEGAGSDGRQGGQPTDEQQQPRPPAAAPASSTASTAPENNGAGSAVSPAAPAQPREDNVSSLHLQGGDVHRSLFRMAEQQQQGDPAVPGADGHAHDSHPDSAHLLPHPKRPHHRRANTIHEAEGVGSDAGSLYGGHGGGGYGSITDPIRSGSPMPVRDLMAPQGFRRDFVLRQRQKNAHMQRRRAQLRARRANSAFLGATRLPITRNFVEFLELYGHFADEDLDTSDGEEEEAVGDDVYEEDEDFEGEGEEEEEEDEDEEGEEGGEGDGDIERAEHHQRRPLLGRRGYSSASVQSAARSKKKAGLAQAFFTLLKAFVGTGIMFLPKAYNNGGLVFSTVTLLIVAALSMAGFRLLLQCRRAVGGGSNVGYGDIGLALGGPRMRSVILGSIALSQLGFVCAGLVFVAENLASFAMAVSGRTSSGSTSAGDGGQVVSAGLLIGLQLLVLVPLAFVRDIARLGPAALLGDVFIALGLTYMYAYDISAVRSRADNGRAGLHETVQLWFNPAGYTLTIGAAIFTFEGIGLILPIQSSMAQPEKFSLLLGIVMVIITCAYVSVGVFGYAAFGVFTKTEVIDNYPRDSPLVQAVQCLYAVAVLAGLPVQLFPAVRIIEGSLFNGRAAHASAASLRYPYPYASGKRNPRIKWAKNGLRTALVVACGAVALLGAGSLDRFVALIGSLACVPLLFIYPPYLHFLGVAGNSWAAKLTDLVLMAVGLVAMVYTTAVTVADGF